MLLILFHLFQWNTVRSQSFDEYRTGYQKAVEASARGDFESSLTHYRSLLSIIPNNPRTLYQIARHHAFLNEDQKAVETLTKLTTMGVVSEAAQDTAFKSLKNHPQFNRIIKQIESMKKPVNHSQSAFTIADKELIPEGIAYDPVTSLFFFGSIPKCKIISVKEDGVIEEFTREKQEGLRSVLGMKVDPHRRILWAASIVGNAPPAEIDSTERGWSGVFQYDLESANLIKKYTIHKMGESHLLNDLVVTREGDVYITDTNYHAVYRILANKDSLELYLEPGHLIYPNGIALSADEQQLYVASMGTIKRIDIKTGRVEPLHQPQTCSMYGIDGLYFHNNTLIAVQNSMNRVCRFQLNRKGDGVKDVEILEANNPELDIPTTGSIVDDDFYYIANCALRAFNPDGTLKKEQLKPLLIYRINL